jgi:integrase/recombinase XerD
MDDLLTTMQGVFDEKWEALFIDWLSDFHANKTRRAYHDAWRDFMKWYGLEKHPKDVKPSHIVRYRQVLETQPRKKTGQPYSPSSINQQLAALASFYRYAITEDAIEHNPVVNVRRKPVSPYGKAVWLDGESRQDVQLLQAINTRTEQGCRDLALFLLFLTSALRLGAVANLRLENLRKQGQKLFIRYVEKGGKAVEKAIEPITAQALELYLSKRAEISPLDGASPLFAPTARGKRAIANLKHTDITARAGEKPLSATAINKLLKAYCNQVFGKGHGITPHSLRHTAARNAVLSGATLAEVSQLLAHKSPAVTLVYLHATDKGGDKVSRKLGKRYEDLD